MKVLVSLFILGCCVDFFSQGAIIETTTELRQQIRKYDTLSKEQKDIVKQFQIKIDELGNDDYLRSDTFAISLLTRNKWNVTSAIKSLKAILRWRQSNDIAKLGETETSPKLLKLFPYHLTTVAKNGCPVLEMDVGKWHAADFMESQDFVRDASKLFVDHGIQMFEKSLLATKKSIPKCDQAFLLLNAKGFTARNYAEPNVLSAAVRLSTTLENYYPDLFKKILFINSSPDVSTMLKHVFPFLGKSTNQLQYFTEAENEAVEKLINEHIDPEQLALKYFSR